MKNIKPLASGDVIRILSGKCKGVTGVVNRIDSETGAVNVFMKGQYLGIWFRDSELKRIGRVTK